MIDSTQVPYVLSSIRDLKLPAHTKADDVTYDQRQKFLDLIKQKQDIAIDSSATVAEAAKKGLDGNWKPYFLKCKAGVITVDTRTAKKIDDCMSSAHWNNDTKPTLEIAGGVIGGLVIVGMTGAGIGSAVRRRRYKNTYGY